MTGHWEMQRSDGSIIGLSIFLETDDPASDAPARNGSRTIESMYILTYVRDGQNVRQYWFKNTPAEIMWDHDHLRLHAVSRDGVVSADLSLDPGASRWQGSYRIADYSAPVILTRPGRSDATAPIGTWSAYGPYFGPYCVHVAMGDDGHLVVRTDFFSTRIVPSENGGQQPRTYESYGASYDEGPQRNDHHWRFAVGTIMGGEIVDGSLSVRGTVFSGGATHYGNGLTPRGNPRLPVSWIRIAGPSCSDSRSSGAAPFKRAAKTIVRQIDP